MKPTGCNNIGKAAHIAAASPGGPRFDAAMTSAQRCCISNGIWLCSTCADLVDNDASKFPVELLHAWKIQAENSAAAEQGQKLPSERELAVYRAKALGENISALSVGELVTEVHRIGIREIEQLDPRFTAEINSQGNTTTIVLIPREPVAFTLHITPEFTGEFKEKMINLRDHGKSLEIDAKAMKVDGTQVLETIFEQPGKVTIATHLRHKAIQRLTWSDSDSGKTMSVDAIGEIVGGARSFTFSGTLFDGLYNMTYQVPLDQQGIITLDANGKLDFSSWENRTVRKLPYFDKFFQLGKALYEGQTLHMAIEIEGQELLTSKSLELMGRDDAVATFGVLHHLSRVRDILQVLETDIPFQATTVSAEDAHWVNEIWFLICRLKSLRGEDIGTATATLIPSGSVEAETLKQSIKDGSPIPMQFQQQFDKPLNLLGQLIGLNKVTLSYTKMVPKFSDRLSMIQAGKGIKLSFVPADDCEAEVIVAKDDPQAHSH